MPNRTRSRPSRSRRKRGPKSRPRRIWARLISGIAGTNLLFWLPIAFLVATLTLWHWSRGREVERIRLFTEEETSRISAAIARRLQTHVDDSARTGTRWSLRDAGDPAEWDYDLFARRWLSPELVTMELIGEARYSTQDASVVPLGPAGTVGAEFVAHTRPSDQAPLVSEVLPPEYIGQAVEDYRVILAGPFFTSEGLPVTATIAAVDRASEPTEWVISVYDLQQMLRFALEGSDSSFGLSLIAGEYEVFASHPGELPLREIWQRTVDFEYEDLTLRLGVWPTAAALERLQSRMPQIALVGGILATVLLALGIGLAQVLSRRASDRRLADSLQAEIRARKRAEASLGRKLGELSRSNQEFERFASAISHDLRDPLNAIGLNVQIVLAQPAGPLAPEDREQMERATAGVTRLDSMLKRLLDYARAGGGPDDLELVDTREVLDDATANLQALVQEHHATIASDELPKVIANRSALARVLQNLLSNAIKYRSERSPEVRVGARRGDDEWIFSVADNGRGMDEVQIGRAFDLFWRGGSATPGEGIGLATCKRIVERHGGLMWVESSPDVGTTFFFSLPADPAGFDQRNQQVSSPPPGQTR